MTEYIEREALLERIDDIWDCADLVFEPNDHCCRVDDCGSCKWAETKNAIRKIIADFPAADVRTVVRAHWYWDKDGMDWNIGAWRCSACHSRPETWWQGDSNSPRNKSGHYYCPNCGAMMEG